MTEPTIQQADGAPVAVAPETATLVLTPPAPVHAVEPAQAVEAVKINPQDIAKLDGMVATYLEGVTSLDVHGPEFAAKVNDIRRLGDDETRQSASVTSRLLDKPMAAMTKGGLSQASEVSRSLLELRHTVEDLDPAHQGDLLSPRKLLGILPFGDRLRDYFAKYQSSQTHLDAIINALYHGKDELGRDNADIEQERENLYAIMGTLAQYVYLGRKLDAALVEKIAAVEVTDPDRARVLREDLLFYVRQKVQDLLTQLAVSTQGFLALDVIRRNNTELIKGVDRATTTTVSALRTAVIVAQALADQKLVLDQITALNSTTSSLIESTSVLLRQQSGQISEQASSSTVELAKLQTAFANIYATMDEIDSFKLKALDNMSKTVDALSAEVAKAEAYVERARAADARESSSKGPAS